MTLLKKSAHIQSDNQNAIVNTVKELTKSSTIGKEGSLSLEGVPSLDHGWVDVCPNQGNKGKSIPIVGSDKISNALKIPPSRDLGINNVFECLEDDAGYVEDAPNLGKRWCK